MDHPIDVLRMYKHVYECIYVHRNLSIYMHIYIHTHMWPICTKPVISQKIKFLDIEQKLDDRHFIQIIILIFILYRNKSLNKINVEGYYFDDFMQIMNL